MNNFKSSAGSWKDDFGGVHVLLSKELGVWVYLSKDISGESSDRPVAIAYSPPKFWQQEKYGRYLIAPSLGVLGAGSIYASTQTRRNLMLQTALQITGVSFICAALYKGLLDPYLHDHAIQISRVREYVFFIFNFFLFFFILILFFLFFFILLFN